MQNVKLFCKLKGITPTTACAECGVGTSFLPDVKRGRTPSVANVKKLAVYLGVTTSQLLGEADPQERKNSPDSISAAEAALNKELITRLCQLTPDELARVDAFVQGILTAR